MSKHINNLLQIVSQHKFIWTLLIFGVVAGFLDENSMLRYWKLRMRNNELRDEITMYESEYRKATSELQRLGRSQRAYVEVARVRLLMKADDEDVYVIE